MGLLEFWIIDGDPDVHYDLAKTMNQYVSTLSIQFILTHNSESEITSIRTV